MLCKGHRCEPANSAPQDGAHGTKRRFQDVRLVKIKRLIGASVFLGDSCRRPFAEAQASDMDYMLIAPRTESLRREIERNHPRQVKVS
jgi:hypothetical protein